MAAGFSVKDALNKNSKAGIDESPRARFRTKDISIFKMYRNDMNFYSVEQIEKLAHGKDSVPRAGFVPRRTRHEPGMAECAQK